MTWPGRSGDRAASDALGAEPYRHERRHGRCIQAPRMRGAMKRQTVIPLAAVGLAAALAVSACSGGGSPIPQQTSAGYNAALGAVVNPSAHRGGTIIFDNSTAPDSTDPGNTYYAYIWNTVRLYGRTLVTYKSAPGAAGLQLVPDLATSLGTVSDHGLAWTYHLKPGIKFEDGTAGHQPGRQVRRRAQLRQRRAARRPVLLHPAAQRPRPIPAPTRTRHPAKWA